MVTSPIERLAEHLAARVKPDEQELVAEWLDYSLNRCGLVVVSEQSLTRPTADLGEDGELVERLREEARREAAAHKLLADAKSARQSDRDDYPDFPIHGYSSIAPEQTTCWQAADRLILYREALEWIANAPEAYTHKALTDHARAVLSRSGG